MFDFLIFEVAALAISGLCIGTLVSFLMPADPARLSGVAARLQANKDPKAGSSIPLRPYRYLVSMVAAGFFLYMQYGLVLRILVDPILTVPFGLALAAFTIDEALLFVWAVYLVRAFRAAARPK